MKPIILVTRPDKGSLFSWYCLRIAVFIAGGIPLKVTSKTDFSNLQFDGVILSGGSDINPQKYQQKSLQGATYDDHRDDMELTLVKQANECKKPILGICRGMELLNIYFEGSLTQELSEIFDDFLPTNSTLGKIFARHKISIEVPSLLNEIFKTTHCKVNSLHHQGVNRLGRDLRSTASLKNGIVQAIEYVGDKWILGVQWHPEYMLHQKKQRGIFKALIYQAKFSRTS